MFDIVVHETQGPWCKSHNKKSKECKKIRAPHLTGHSVLVSDKKYIKKLVVGFFDLQSSMVNNSRENQPFHLQTNKNARFFIKPNWKSVWFLEKEWYLLSRVRLIFLAGIEHEKL